MDGPFVEALHSQASCTFIAALYLLQRILSDIGDENKENSAFFLEENKINSAFLVKLLLSYFLQNCRELNFSRRFCRKLAERIMAFILKLQ